MRTPSHRPSRPPTPRGCCARRRASLDHLGGDIDALGARLPSAQRPKLQAHTDALRALEKKLTVQLAGGGATCSAGALKTRVEGAGTGAAPPAAARLQTELELNMDILATAFACGARRSATLLTQGASSGIKSMGGAGDHHQVSHGEVPNSKAIWKQIDAWYAERFATWMKMQTERQILDSTVTVWATEISEDHSQLGFVMPVAGGAGLGMKLGRAYGSKDTVSNLWVSVQKAMGIPKDTFGTGSSGGIPGLFSPT